MTRSLATLGLVVVLGCDGVDAGASSSTDAGAAVATPGTVLLLVSVNPEPLCGTVGVTQVQLLAHRTGCGTESGEPCMLEDSPRTDGDTFTCPNTEPSILLGIELDRAGRYQVQIVTEFTTGDTRARCATLSGDPEITLTDEEVDAGSVRMLDAGDVACP